MDGEGEQVVRSGQGHDVGGADRAHARQGRQLALGLVDEAGLLGRRAVEVGARARACDRTADGGDVARVAERRCADAAGVGRGLEGGRMMMPRGKMLGGCSGINYMAHVHGHPGDYDAWAAGGADRGAAGEAVLDADRAVRLGDERHVGIVVGERLHLRRVINLARGLPQLALVELPLRAHGADQRTIARPFGAACDIGAVEAIEDLFVAFDPNVTNVTRTFRDGEERDILLFAGNTGQRTAVGVHVQLTFPAGVTVHSVTPPAGTTYDAGAGVWTVGDILPGDQTQPLVLRLSRNTPGDHVVTVRG